MSNQLDTSNPTVDMLIMRYIRAGDEAKTLLSTLAEWEVTCSSRETRNPVDWLRLLEDSVSTSPDVPSLAPVKLWDYPVYDLFEVSSPLHAIEKNMRDLAKNKESIRFLLVELLDFSVVHIREADVPDHYPFPFTIAYRFQLKNVPDASTKANLISTLVAATTEIKELTNTVSPYSEYRPVYWFLNGFPEECMGLRGLPETVQRLEDKDAETTGTVWIERGFPYASYILYNMKPNKTEIRLADLSLLSVIAHITERGYRNELYGLVQQVVREVATFQKNPVNGQPTQVPATIEDLKSSISQLSQIQSRIYPLIEKFFSVRRRLVRSRGLVQRIRQICGNDEPGKRTFFDVICDDALTLIEDEASLSEDEVATSFKAVGDRLNTLNSQLNNEYSQRSSRQSQELQKIGILLQATAFGWIAFQVADKLLPQTIWDSADLRAAAQFGISVLFFGITVLGLWLMSRDKSLGTINEAKTGS